MSSYRIHWHTGSDTTEGDGGNVTLPGVVDTLLHCVTLPFVTFVLHVEGGTPALGTWMWSRGSNLRDMLPAILSNNSWWRSLLLFWFMDAYLMAYNHHLDNRSEIGLINFIWILMLYLYLLKVIRIIKFMVLLFQIQGSWKLWKDSKTISFSLTTLSWLLIMISQCFNCTRKLIQSLLWL